jgi:DNA topoisomerase-3
MTIYNYLKVPYEEKDEAKKLGAKWDKDRKLWFVEKPVKQLEKYEIVCLNVPYEEKDKVKKLGAFWDINSNCWKTTEGNLELNPELREYELH